MEEAPVALQAQRETYVNQKFDAKMVFDSSHAISMLLPGSVESVEWSADDLSSVPCTMELVTAEGTANFSEILHSEICSLEKKLEEAEHEKSVNATIEGELGGLGKGPRGT